MLHLSTETTIMNKFRRFVQAISVETCLKMDYFGTVVNYKKSPTAARSSGGWGFALRPPFRFND